MHDDGQGYSPDLTVVVIGRNEGDRLVNCLRSLRGEGYLVVYVDSGSTDASVANARGAGAQVVALDMAQPFTAARARNAGFDHALQCATGLKWVQFVDGDCELAEGWLRSGKAYLERNPDVAVVFGRQRERYRDRSIYNYLCEMEWAVAPGEVKACGGCAMMRCDAFAQALGFREGLIAGEEPELCVRLRAQGWRIRALPNDMALHDAAMTHFGQWWRRSIRAGYAFAEGASIHGKPPERHWVWESRRAWLWGLGVPICALTLSGLFGPWALAIFGMYPAQVLRQFVRLPGTAKERALKAVFQTVGRFPELVGQILFWRNRLLRRNAQLIEYKS